MIVLSYPRSGSNYLCNAIDAFYKKEYEFSLNLNEFTNISSPQTWGNILLQKNKMVDGVHTEIRTISLNENITQYKDLFLEKMLYVSDKSKIDLFIKQEHDRRLKFLKQLDFSDVKYVVKMFPGSDSCLPLESNHQQILLYRKDLVGCLLSRMIKTKHYDEKITHDGKIGNVISEIGHNYSNTPAPKVIPGVLDATSIRYHVKTFGKLLTMYQKYDNIPIISYEDMFDGKTIFISGIEMSPKDITEKYVKKPELKMDYSLTGNKEDFFTNTEIISEIIEEEMNNSGLKNIAKELGVHW